jgi:dATP pyrophosphohydrolase
VEKPSSFKRPESVLVVVATHTKKVLLLRRADHENFWQSVTGAMAWEEQRPLQTAGRELEEETGIAAEGIVDLHTTFRYPILPQWRHRYAPDVQENLEHVFTLTLTSERSVRLNPRDHVEYGWFDFDTAANKVWSRTNRDVIVKLKTAHE